MSDPITSHVMGEQLDPRAAGGQTQLCSWQLSPEFPTPEELMATAAPPLPVVAPGEEFASKAEYLEMQYRLQRYEGTELLRNAINSYRKAPGQADGENAYIYTQVHVKGYVFARSGAACRISFSTERSSTKVTWAPGGRLTAGTLVALSPRSDNFKKQCYVAVVAARYVLGGLEPDPRAGEDENTPPRIEIFWADAENAKIDPTVELVMLEAKGGYFETVRHAMVGLQHAAFIESKFDKYIVEGHTKSPTAAYLQEVPGQTAIVPKAASTFDHSQMEAFRCMTTRELAMVQGPPGTGKTFTSVVAIESFVRTLHASRGKDEPPVPVIVAAQTNHALDQLLEKCLENGTHIARLGGRSTADSINERSIYNIRKNSKAARPDVNGEMSRKNLLQKAKDSLSMCFPGGIISAEHFHRQGLLTQEQFTSLEEDDWESIDTVNAAGSVEDDSFGGSMGKWLDGCIEEDKTYVYRPPRNQVDNPATHESDCDREDDQPDDDERERLQGDFLCTEFYWTGTIPGNLRDDAAWCFQARKLLTRFSDLYKIKPPQRGMVYRYLRKSLVDKASREFPKLLIEHQKMCDTLKISRWQNNVKVLSHEGIQVLGCTTTGLTKYRGLIAALKPRILMIEEAAETRESNITSALYPSLDQVVLVGDHQQLVPQVDVHILGHPPYNLHVSLFERLVRLQLPYSMLCVQRRMIPSIREVVHAFYPKLEDHESVKDSQNRPPVPGMGGRPLWWFQHQWGEQHDADAFAYFNLKEADMIVGFVQYLVQNGMRPSQITVLTYYKGQVKLILETLKKNRILSILNPTKQWDVRTVDGFQGEENEIILLSLVRSRQNPHDRAKVGFTKNENRAVVATSRARCGMYIFGNSNQLLDNPESRETWQKVYNVFVQQKSIGYKLPVIGKPYRMVDATKLVTRNAPTGMLVHAGVIPSRSSDANIHARRLYYAATGALLSAARCVNVIMVAIDLPCAVLSLIDPGSLLLDHLARHLLKLSTLHTLPSRLNNVHRLTGFLKDFNPLALLNLIEVASRAEAEATSEVAGRTKGEQNPPIQMPTRVQSHVYDRRATTSEDLINGGYRAHLEKQATARGGHSKENTATDTLSFDESVLIDMTPKLEKTEKDSSSEESVSDKWSAKNFQAREQALEKSLKADRLRTKPVPSTTVQETYRQVTADANGTRAMSRVTRSEYTLPAVCEMVREPLLDLISGDPPMPSRKQQVLDAGAGYHEMELGVAPLQPAPKGTATAAVAVEPTSEEDEAADNLDIDLLTFD
ncbi:Fc.00g035160.m01.CDS01 [Cosmosporella sp. VM-42]